MSFWKTAGWIAAGVGAVVAAPVTGGGSIAAVLGAAGATTATGVAIGAGVGLVGSALTDDSKDRAKEEGRREGLAERAIETSKLKTALEEQQSYFSSQKEYFDFILALQTVGMACAACDGEISVDEQQEINEFVGGIASSELPQNIKDEVLNISNSRPTIGTAFQLAKPFMQTAEQKDSFEQLIIMTIHADGEVHSSEEVFLDAWKSMAA